MRVTCFHCCLELLPSDEYLTVNSSYETVDRLHLCCALELLRNVVDEYYEATGDMELEESSDATHHNDPST